MKVLSFGIHMKFPASSRQGFFFVNDSDLNNFKLLKPLFSETLLKHNWQIYGKKETNCAPGCTNVTEFQRWCNTASRRTREVNVIHGNASFIQDFPSHLGENYIKVGIHYLNQSIKTNSMFLDILWDC